MLPAPIIPYDSPPCYHSSMRHLVVLLIHLIVVLTQLLQLGGVRSLVAESLLLKHQLLIVNRSRQRSPHLSSWDPCLANCYFAHNSLRFSVLLPFFNASFPRPFHPLNRHPNPVASTWRRPFPHCRVSSTKTPAPDRKSLPATISHAILVGPHPCRLDGALGPSYSSSSFRNCTEAFYPASPSQSHEQAKVPHAVLTESPSEARPERTDHTGK